MIEIKHIFDLVLLVDTIKALVHIWNLVRAACVRCHRIKCPLLMAFLSSGKELLWVAFVGWSFGCWKKVWKNMETEYGNAQNEDD